MITVKSTPDEIIRQNSFVPNQSSYDDYVNKLKNESALSDEDARTVATSVITAELEKNEIDVKEWKFTVIPSDLQTKKYGFQQVENYRVFQGSYQKLAAAMLLVSVVAGLALYGGATILAVRGLASIALAAKEATSVNAALKAMLSAGIINKLKGIAWLAIPSFIQDSANRVAQFAQVQQSSTGDALAHLLQAAVKNEDTSAATTRAISSGAVGTPAEPRQTKTTGTKYKIYVGTLAGGRVAEGLPFAPIIDDEITDTADLMQDVMKNLTLWLSKAPSQMTWEIQIKLAPYDTFGVRKQGYWLSLSLYYTSRWAKRLFMEEILLGPVDPVKYPVLDRESVSVTTPLLSGGTMATDQTQIISSGRIAATDNEGNVVEVLPAAPATAAKTEPVTSSSVQTPSSSQSATAPVSNASLSWPMQHLGIEWGDTMIVDNARGAVNLRADPNTSGKIYMELPNGTEVKVIGNADNANGYTWVMVDVPSLGKGGYVAFDFLKKKGTSQVWAPKEVATTAKTEVMQISVPEEFMGARADSTTVNYKVNTPGSTLTLRTTGDTSGQAIAKLADGTKLFKWENVGKADGYTWARVAVPSISREGYVATEFLTAL